MFARTEATRYGPGLLVLGDRVSPRPLFFGHSASRAHLPSRRPAIAVATTNGPAAPGGHSAHTIVQRVAAAPAPAHSVPEFG
ncbi:hypothetical protein GCM10010275_63400 [Streptomyces litmocidini]|uniref:hypothetical protein n=1 Tax=Streptomyces litmocidini TaxID=67318 RepID=UPI00167E20CA|nr:hypothetical protein [Streptomyces litmocidini]GGV13567.1 hypothetical protein GCM10010275_63400 [Streptomyces litmocidini]